jgi:hypothetical protein
MAEDYSDLDEMVGNMKAKINGTSMKRMTPAKNVKTFETRTKISADPENPTVAKIMKALQNGDMAEARKVANSSEAIEFLNEFINEYDRWGGQEEGRWMFARLIHKGKKGKNAKVQVELNFQGNEMTVVEVPKSYIYAITGQKWRKIGVNNLLPKANAEAFENIKEIMATTTPDVGPDSIDNVDNPPHNTEGIAQKAVMDSASTPTSPSDEAPPTDTEDDPLVNLIGGQTTQLLKSLGLRDKVKIEDIDMTDFKVIDGTNSPVRIISSTGKEMQITDPITNSCFGPTNHPDTPFDVQDMDSLLSVRYKSMEKALKKRGSREEVVRQLREISIHMDSLSRVFGFDDPKQLEAFFAAWLMEDSTCRLTGIPGTGKTTVINSAATLLSNSYGFNEMKRYMAKKPVINGEPHEYMVFPSGQRYDVNYGDKQYATTRDSWELWRFTEWEDVSDVSGAYLWDFRFLQRHSDSGKGKLPLSPDDYTNFLFAKPDFTINKDTGDVAVLNTISAKGKTMADMRELFGVKSNDKLPRGMGEQNGFAMFGGSPLYSDSGGNEGFALREFLLEHFYDSRLDEGKMGMSNIVAEMLEECGVAKIDYDKRAEEILYGIEIRQITEKNPLTQVTTSSYQFDPTPRPVVTQPIKFFNEANRSGSGVEDAILGLIAEKTVEYRGQRFTSPNFVAWMDTNPHQKGNDLAFVDRIDMELYFGTLSLGGRFNTLVERYGGVESEGGTPEIQLVNRMLGNKGSSQFIAPMRFYQLKECWGTVNNMDFNASGSAEDQGALLDISLLSVLFTQKWMVKEGKDKIYGGEFFFRDVAKVYDSPLADISTTTNSQYESDHEEWWGGKFGNGSTDRYQAPVAIDRMLGFRFTNSMVKMTRALAFLRGKTHVTRQEVLDSLPYCVGHRLGPAREGEDPKGRDIGINREAMKFENEQAFIRDFILDGYVLRNTKAGLGAVEGKPSLMDVWDSFVKNCETYINSTDAYWKYENDIILPVKDRVRNGATGGVTPVHWSICTMAVDNVRRDKEYKVRTASYLERLQRPQSAKGTKTTPQADQQRQLLANNSASQYYQLRGEIASDPKLFSDDRNNLLALADSKIEAICGGTMDDKAIGPIVSRMSCVAPTDGDLYEGFGEFIKKTTPNGEPNPLAFKWRTYGDGMGAWGNMITGGDNVSGAIAQLGGGGEAMDVSGAQFESNQTLAATYQIRIPADGLAEYGPFVQKMKRVATVLKEYTEEGVHFAPKGTKEEIKENYGSFAEYITQAQEMLAEWTQNKIQPQNDLISTTKSGFNACFVLNHHSSAVDGAMEFTLPTGRTIKIQGEDKLRLWASLRCIEGDNEVGSEPMMGFFIGITSATMRPTRKIDAGGTSIETDADGMPLSWEILPFTENDSYTAKFYGDDTEWAKYQYQDVGNLTTDDYRSYVQIVFDAITVSDE